VEVGEMLCARSIKPLEGGRWRLRRMRADGRPQSNGYGIESFFVCSLLILRDLQKSKEGENRS
jgi:hypothetical protein